MNLPPRQYELIRLRATGATIGEAAERTGIAEQTAKNHLRFAYARLGVSSLVEACAKLGWLQVPERDTWH